MASLSTQKLNQYYDDYRKTEIAFNKSIIKALGLETRNIFLKIKGDPWPCVLYSCSMAQAKIIINLDTLGFEEIKRAKNFVNLRLAFFPSDAKSSIYFFVPSVVKGYSVFNIKSTERLSFLMTIEFTQKPPDDLIEILGKVIESNENFKKRQSLRINLDGKVVTDIGLSTNKIIAEIDNIKRACILKNISANGVMVIMSCIPKFIMKKKCYINILIQDSSEPLVIEGTVVRYEEVTDRKDIYGIGVEFVPEKVPFEYKDLINKYIDKLEEMAKHDKIKR
ncbi:MAG: PilZ domain protein [Spirochaetes bacterium ADurb.Bin133]|nr:MAG: PilZ domain protein [Spirochaetes bacterium ADurb.Bin133]